MTFSSLIRFRNLKGKELFGEPEIKHADDLQSLLGNKALFAVVLDGSSPFDITRRTDIREQVKELLPVLRPKDVPIIKCVGLNYMKHIAEGGRKPPPYPSIFVKPSASVAGFNEDIQIPKIAQENQLDYEGELSIVIGKTGKDISKDKALEYIAGYMTSNDMSARTWQRDPAFAGVAPQWCFSKGFDKFAPLGPLLVSPTSVGDASNLRLQTWVNDELRQDAETSDLLFGVVDIVSFISQGTTLEKGTVIMTGTPAGVAMGMKEPMYLSNGDVVKVRIDQLGTVENKMAFQE
ncbi:5-carboxymethyl-2-hydroxymuconate isomerase [Stemphylium lycopersici]|uniref:5-carboxymethyl-2-hydroxymuconate isomerase n=1 Tax=Stemphylium lycopersici TaxID=183478 RepID=A0A364N7E6_STELY|nr:5-carboxymethyl-2-hydroxymuconate isomerase [Stemphylium lycopersici]